MKKLLLLTVLVIFINMLFFSTDTCTSTDNTTTTYIIENNADFEPYLASVNNVIAYNTEFSNVYITYKETVSNYIKPLTKITTLIISEEFDFSINKLLNAVTVVRNTFNPNLINTYTYLTQSLNSGNNDFSNLNLSNIMPRGASP